ncbi:MAG: hypothetical protein K0B85_01055 [Coriobacteriia bacterium]|nr:hypothetical protein [Coriobacteriia bacterium]
MGKHRKCGNNWFMKLLLACFVGLTLAAISYTLAFFTDEGSAENFITARSHNVALVDLFDKGQFTLPGDTVPKVVYMRNTGGAKAVIRMRLTPSWDPAQAGEYVLDPAVVTVHLGETVASDWTFYDGWYYYNHILEPGDATGHLVEAIELGVVANDAHAADYSGASYTLDVEGESLRADATLTQDEWNIGFQVDAGTAITWLTP